MLDSNFQRFLWSLGPCRLGIVPLKWIEYGVYGDLILIY